MSTVAAPEEVVNAAPWKPWGSREVGQICSLYYAYNTMASCLNGVFVVTLESGGGGAGMVRHFQGLSPEVTIHTRFVTLQERGPEFESFPTSDRVYLIEGSLPGLAECEGPPQQMSSLRSLAALSKVAHEKIYRMLSHKAPLPAASKAPDCGILKRTQHPGLV